MTLQELRQSTEPTVSIPTAAAIMGIRPQLLRVALQQGKFPFGVAVKLKKWVYYVNRDRFIQYLEGGETQWISNGMTKR